MCPNRWSILENVACALKNNVHPIVLGKLSCIYVLDVLFIVLVKYSVFLLFFYLVLSIVEDGVLKSSPIFVELPVVSSDSVNFYFIYFNNLLL